MLFRRKKDKKEKIEEKVEEKKKKREEVKKKEEKKEAKKETKPKSMKELYGGGEVGKKEVKKEKGKEAGEIKKDSAAYRILIKPLVTEKAANLSAENKYVFAVAPRANKIEVARAIKDVYGVKPVKVNIVKVRGKQVRYGRTLGKRKDWKKAIITLPAGESINVYEGV
jgi:large subunit ribosomal protein L23